MRPVVSSLVAIALALAPMSAMAAKPHSKTPHAKVVNADANAESKADDKSENAEEDSDKTDKPHHAKAKPHAKKEKDRASPIVPAKVTTSTHGSKKSAIKPIVHHAHNVDLGGPGHKEPKVGSSGAIIPASMVTKAPHEKAHEKENAHAKPSKAADLPKLPNPHAGKPSKGGAEKGAARKPAEKKADASSDDNAGEPERDEDFAELVARIRGKNVVSHDHDEHDEGARDEGGAKAKAPPPSPRPLHVAACTKEPVEIVRGPEIEHIQLTKCDGTVAPLAVEQLSILIRPGGVARPTAPLADLAKKPGKELGFGIRRVDPRLVTRLQTLVDHFSRGDTVARVFIISGYRPASVGSMHSTGRAIDFRVEGVRNEDVVSFCKTLTDTGCGYYPNSSFVHVDVRDTGAGHVTWIDASGPGETPRYVRSWPPPPSQQKAVDRVSTQALEDEGVKILRAQRPYEPISPFEDDPAEPGSAPDAADAH